MIGFKSFALTLGYLLSSSTAAPTAQHVVIDRQHDLVPGQHDLVERQQGVTDVNANIVEKDRPTYLGNGIYTDPNRGNNAPFFPFPFPFFPPQQQTPPPPCPACPPQTPCPTCPMLPPTMPPCVANQSVVNPGFELNGGSFPPWTVSDPTAVLLDSMNGMPDPQGLHSAQFILSATTVSAWINQNVTVCPNRSYKIYFAVKLLAQAPASPTAANDQGKFTAKENCNIFASLSGAGSSITTGTSLNYATYNTITTTTTFTTGNVTNANIMISVVCSVAAFVATPALNGYMYFDNIYLNPV